MVFFHKYKYWIFSGKFTAIQKVSILGIGIFSFMILARQLGPADFGVWGIFISIAAITETARTALVRNAFIKYMNQVELNEQSKLQAAALVLNFSLGIVLSIILLFISNRLSTILNAPGLNEMLKFYSLSLIMTTFFTHAEMLLNSKMMFNKILWLQISRQGTLLILISFAYLFHIELNLTLLSVYYLIAVLFGVVIGFLICKPYILLEFKETQKWVFILWNYGRFVFGNNISSLIFRSTDSFMASSYFGTVISAYYNVCLRISNLIDMPSVVFSEILFPKAVKFGNDDKLSIKNIYEKAVGATLVFSFPALLLLFLFPEAILKILAGSDFIQAAIILRITVFFGFTLPFLKQFGTVMDATGHPNVSFRLMFFALIFNVISNVVCISLIGYLGAAIGTAITYMLLFLISQYIMYKKYGVLISNIFKNTFNIYSELLKYGRFKLGSRFNL